MQYEHTYLYGLPEISFPSIWMDMMYSPHLFGVKDASYFPIATSLTANGKRLFFTETFKVLLISETRSSSAFLNVIMITFSLFITAVGMYA